MDEKKRFGIFIIGAALIILIAMAIFVLIFNSQQKKANNQPTITTTTAQNADLLRQEALQNQTTTNYTYDENAEKNRSLVAEDLRMKAKSFAERFGSYTNQSNYDNFNDLKIFMTSKMISWVDDYIAGLKKTETDQNGYYGMTTAAVSGTVKKFSDTAGTAEISVTTQRREVTGSAEPKVFSQDILITYKKTGTDWKVDSAVWQK